MLNELNLDLAMVKVCDLVWITLPSGLIGYLYWIVDQHFDLFKLIANNVNEMLKNLQELQLPSEYN